MERQDKGNGQLKRAISTAADVACLVAIVVGMLGAFRCKSMLMGVAVAIGDIIFPPIGLLAANGWEVSLTISDDGSASLGFREKLQLTILQIAYAVATML